MLIRGANRHQIRLQCKNRLGQISACDHRLYHKLCNAQMNSKKFQLSLYKKHSMTESKKNFLFKEINHFIKIHVRQLNCVYKAPNNLSKYLIEIALLWFEQWWQNFSMSEFLCKILYVGWLSRFWRLHPQHGESLVLHQIHLKFSNFSFSQSVWSNEMRFVK